MIPWHKVEFRVVPFMILLLIAVLLTGCKTTKTKSAETEMFNSLIDDCHAFVLALDSQRQTALSNVSDPKDLIILSLINQQNAPRVGDCNNVVIAMLNADAQTRTALIQGGFSLATFGLGAWAAASMVDSITDLGASKGHTSISGSRAVVDSGNYSSNGAFSASGEGMGLGNVNVDNGSFGQGGLQNRQATINDATSTTAPSQSGSNEPLQVDPGDDVMAQPVEE